MDDAMLDERFRSMDQRFDGVDQRLDRVERRLDAVESQVAGLRTEMHSGFTQIDNRLLQFAFGLVGILLAAFASLVIALA